MMRSNPSTSSGQALSAVKVPVSGQRADGCSVESEESISEMQCLFLFLIKQKSQKNMLKDPSRFMVLMLYDQPFP